LWQDTLDEVDTDRDGMISMTEYLSWLLNHLYLKNVFTDNKN